MQFLEKVLKMWENIEILDLSQQKEEETIWCQNEMIVLQSFSQKFITNRNENNVDTNEKSCLFRTFNTRIK